MFQTTCHFIYVQGLAKEEIFERQRLFSTGRNFPRAAQFFFVCEPSARTNRKKTKKNCAENSAQWKTAFKPLLNGFFSGLTSRYQFFLLFFLNLSYAYRGGYSRPSLLQVLWVQIIFRYCI